MKRIVRFLNQPYPINLHCPKTWITIVFISVFVFLFMAVFKPFGIPHSNLFTAYLVMAGYGGVTFVVLIFLMKVFPIVIPRIFDEKNWKVKQEILLILTIIFFIGIGNMIYSKIIFDFPKSWLKGFILFELYTLAVGVIPVIVLVMVSQINMLKKNLKAAASVNEKIQTTKATEKNHETIKITSDNKNEVLNLAPANFLLAKSEGNYIDIFYVDEEEVEKKMFRSSLKKMKENFLNDLPFFQCHRAFIINLEKVKKAEGNSQGFLLDMEGMDFKVPVSRNYVNKFKALFN